jgi:hypothetical protein
MTSLLALLMLAVSGLAIAAGTETTGAIPLKDGNTVHIYKDGKMTMEDKVGKPMTMPQGTPMETKSGTVIMMKGNEVWRLYQSTDKSIVDDLMREGH